MTQAVAIPVVAIPVVAIPVVAIPVVAIPVVATPVVAIPAVAIPAVAIPAAAIPAAAIPAAAIPAAEKESNFRRLDADLFEHSLSVHRIAQLCGRLACAAKFCRAAGVQPRPIAIPDANFESHVRSIDPAYQRPTARANHRPAGLDSRREGLKTSELPVGHRHLKSARSKSRAQRP